MFGELVWNESFHLVDISENRVAAKTAVFLAF